MRKILSFFLLVTFSLSAEVHEINHFDELHSYLTNDTLIVLDIDNTLIEPAQELGTDQWFYHRIQDYKTWGFNKSEALEKALHEWESIQHITKVRLCEKGSDEIVKNLQNMGYTIMGLTTRGLGMSTLTIHQLKRCNIDLSKTAPSLEEVHFMNPRGVLYRGGILFTAATHKGEGMKTLFEKIGFKPKRIIFVNDKRTHINQFRETMVEDGVEFIGLRYGYTDDRVLNFRNHIAEVQFSFFGHIMTDQQAERILHEIKKVD